MPGGENGGCAVSDLKGAAASRLLEDAEVFSEIVQIGWDTAEAAAD